MTTNAESALRVKKHAQTLIRRGVEPRDAVIHASGAEAQGRLTGVERVRLAAEGNGRHGVSNAQIIAMGEAAPREAKRGIPFHMKIARCAGTPDNECDELAKALRATEATLAALKASVRSRQNRPAPATTISARAPAIPVRPIPRRLPGRPPAPTPAPARPMIGPSRAEHNNGWNLDHSYYDFRDRLAGDLRAKLVRPDPAAIISHSVASYGLDAGDAAEWCERFMGCISRDLERRASLNC
jgi:hypothetical protein